MSPVFDDLTADAKAGRARKASMAIDREPFFKGASPGPEDDRFLRPRPAGASDGGLLDDFDQEFSQGPLDDADFEPEEGMKVFHQSPLAQRSRRDSDYRLVRNKAGQHWAYVEESPAVQARTPEEEAAHRLQLRDETRYLHGGQELSDEEGQKRNDRNLWIGPRPGDVSRRTFPRMI